MKCIYNFGLTEENMVSLPLQNRAFQYGDGLFETMRHQNGKVCYLPDHLERLFQGLNLLQMKLPDRFTSSYLETAVESLLQANQLSDTARIRLQAWRKAGGLYTPSQREAEFCISVQPFIAAPAVKKKVLFYKDIRLSYSPLSSLKTCNALPYIMAGLAKTQAGVDDMILLDTEGHVSECIASNIFWMKDKILFTPSLQSGCIAGVMRKQILNQAKTLAISIQEGLFPAAEILEADAVFCSNIASIQGIRQIENTIFDISKLPEELLKIG